MKKLIVSAVLLCTSAEIYAGQTFKTWCNNVGGDGYAENLQILNFDGLAQRNGYNYAPIANLELKNDTMDYHYFIASNDKAVYDASEKAYLLGISVNACTLNSGGQSYLVGVEMNQD